MAVTYVTKKYGLSDVKFPVLHRVVYAKNVDDIVSLYQYSYKDHLVNSWLKENCKHPYYHNPGYTKEKFIDFECDEEATFFALRWA